LTAPLPADLLGGGGAAGREHRAQVRLEQLVELGGADVEDRRAGRFGDAGTVHQNVDGAEFVNTPVHQRLRGLLIGW
jgi:hypothetical protein